MLNIFSFQNKKDIDLIVLYFLFWSQLHYDLQNVMEQFSASFYHYTWHGSVLMMSVLSC